MKKYLQKLDTLGLLLLVAAVIWYSVSNVWEKWNLGLAIAGGVLVIIGIAANYRQILASLGKRSTKYAGNYVVSLDPGHRDRFGPELYRAETSQSDLTRPAAADTRWRRRRLRCSRN